MKLAIICLTKDFSKPGNSGSYRDYLYIKTELESIAEVITINSDNVASEMSNKFDGIIMLNASVNFFGGILNQNLVEKWKFVCNQTCPVLYWFTDFLLPLVKVDQIISRRFTVDLPKLDSKRIKVVSYAQETEMTKDWWNKNNKNIEIENIVYYDISESCFKNLPHLEPKKLDSKEFIYIGNFRNGHRRKQIKKLSEEIPLTIYGKWDRKYIPFGTDYNGVCLETEVDDILNNHWAQFITYDYEYIEFKPAIFRNVITINSGTIPYIDPKLDYIINDLEFGNILSDYNRIQELENFERSSIVKILQTQLNEKFQNKFPQLIKKLCS